MRRQALSASLEKRLGLEERLGKAERPKRPRAARLRCAACLTCALLLTVLLGLTIRIPLITVSQSPHVLLLTVTPRCTAKHGQFFLTKALQSKAYFARALNWELWPTSLPSGDASASSRWPELVLQMLSMRLAEAERRRPTWYAWMGPSILATHTVDMPWAEWDAFDTHVVLVAGGGEEVASPKEMAPTAADVSVDVAFVRASEWSRGFLEAWVAAMDEARDVEASLQSNGGSSSEEADPALTALAVLLSDARWREHVRIEPRSRRLLSALHAGLARRVPLAPAAAVSNAEADANAAGDDARAAEEDFPMLLDFAHCGLCAPLSAIGSRDLDDEDAADSPRAATLAREQSAEDSAAASCQRALLRAFTAIDDAGPLAAIGAEHPVAGSVHVRPALQGTVRSAGLAVRAVWLPQPLLAGSAPADARHGPRHGLGRGGRRGGGWLQAHRGGLGRCLPSLLVVGSQRSSLGSLHWALRRGWHRQLRVGQGERELHFFSMDNRYREGLLSYERRFHPNSTRRDGCPLPPPPAAAAAAASPSETSAASLAVDISSTYFDYPKAPLRVFSVLPAARIAVLLREPVSRALSAFNLRWLTWLCGKLMWSRPDCWASVTDEAAVRKAQVRATHLRPAQRAGDCHCSLRQAVAA